MDSQNRRFSLVQSFEMESPHKSDGQSWRRFKRLVDTWQLGKSGRNQNQPVRAKHGKKATRSRNFGNRKTKKGEKKEREKKIILLSQINFCGFFRASRIIHLTIGIDRIDRSFWFLYIIRYRRLVITFSISYRYRSYCNKLFWILDLILFVDKNLLFVNYCLDLLEVIALNQVVACCPTQLRFWREIWRLGVFNLLVIWSSDSNLGAWNFCL